MAKIKRAVEIQNLTTLEEVKRFINSWLTNITDVLNGNVEFGQNIRTTEVTVYFQRSDTEQAVFHGLGRLPNGYIKVGSSVDFGLYDGNQATTSSVIWLRASQVGTAKILFY